MLFKSNVWFFAHERNLRTLRSHVASSLKKMIKNVQVTGDSIDEDDLDEAVGSNLAKEP